VSGLKFRQAAVGSLWLRAASSSGVCRLGSGSGCLSTAALHLCCCKKACRKSCHRLHSEYPPGCVSQGRSCP
jgi:hypothetical protein